MQQWKWIRYGALVFCLLGVGTVEAQRPSPVGAQRELQPPSLSGDAAQVVAQAEAWISDFKLKIADSLVSGRDRINAGETPTRVIPDLQAAWSRSKRMLGAETPGFRALIGVKQQELSANIKNSEKATAQSDLEGTVKQAYADAIAVGGKNLERMRRCDADAGILSGRVDELTKKSSGWEALYESSVGLIGDEKARTQVAGMLEKESAAWRPR